MDRPSNDGNGTPRYVCCEGALCINLKVELFETELDSLSSRSTEE